MAPSKPSPLKPEQKKLDSFEFWMLKIQNECLKFKIDRSNTKYMHNTLYRQNNIYKTQIIVCIM